MSFNGQEMSLDDKKRFLDSFNKFLRKQKPFIKLGEELFISNRINSQCIQIGTMKHKIGSKSQAVLS